MLRDVLGEQVFGLMKTLRSVAKALKNTEHLTLKLPQSRVTSINHAFAAHGPHPSFHWPLNCFIICARTILMIRSIWHLPNDHGPHSSTSQRWLRKGMSRGYHCKKFCADNAKYMKNMKEAHEAKQRSSASQGSNRKVVDDSRRLIQRKLSTSERCIIKENRKGTMIERSLPRNCLSKPIVNATLPNPDVVSDILNMMGSDLERATPTSPAVNVRCVQKVAEVVEVSLTERQKNSAIQVSMLS